ncbi:hypothetical protein OS189_01195 [Sulfitobacter sp. F26169L]|uniref:hypothetical protein n=1 Tax=Sulfitobacter sp. F26169L TaxID=2996015 RepID=UPI002260AC6F|nr:hypothetical protein [Sulfitobacter sp. F26169L]MCX7564956.1 hypothetical protein [Sulfitobacter sp. F26169L]
MNFAKGLDQRNRLAGLSAIERALGPWTNVRWWFKRERSRTRRNHMLQAVVSSISAPGNGHDISYDEAGDHWI